MRKIGAAPKRNCEDATTRKDPHMTTSLARSGAAAAAALLALTVTACGSDSDSDSDSDPDVATDSAAESSAPTEPSDDSPADSEPEDAGDPASGLPVVAVGETFTIEAIGTFSATYLGLGDLGRITTLQGDEVQCYAILGEVTLVAEGDIAGPGLSPQRADALDSSGAVIDVNSNAECPQSVTTAAGYTGAFSVEWVEGAAETIAFDIVSVPVDAVDQIDHIQITPSTPEFELDATVTETL